MLINLSKKQITVLSEFLDFANQKQIVHYDPEIDEINQQLRGIIGACECQAQKQTSPPN
tara:strand:+ start:212 stop:388 length:177 start_codon:yes stop_codon:yes gene_type:complete